MKNIIKAASVILCLLTVLSLFPSCAVTDTPGYTDTSAEVTSDTVQTPYVTDPAAPDTEDPFSGVYPEAEPVTIFSGGSFSCIFVFPQYETDLMGGCATEIALVLGEIAGAAPPLVISDKLYKEDRYADRCVFLVGKTAAQGTEEFEKSAPYGQAAGRLIGNRYQLCIHDAADCAAFESWLREKLGEEPSEIVVDPSWNVSIPTAGETASKIVRFDGAVNGNLTKDSAGTYIKYLWDVDAEKFGAYVEKCVSSGFEMVSETEDAGNARKTVLLSGGGLRVLAGFDGSTGQAVIAAADANVPVPEDLIPDDMEKDYEKWLALASEYCDRLDTDTVVSDKSATLSWWSAYILNSLLNAYCRTNDMKYLTKLADSLYGIYLLAADNDGDGYRNWGVSDMYGGVGYNEFVVHSGAVASAAADFLNLLAGKPSLYSEVSEKHGITFREMADHILDVTVNDIIPAFDCDWSDEYGVYMNRLSDIEDNGVAVRKALPNNQYLMMAYALLELSKLDIGAERTAEYLRRAELMVNKFDSFVERRDDGTMLWRYMNMISRYDYESVAEDTSHGMMDLRTVIAAHNAGIAFTSEDLAAFARTYATVAAFDPSPDFVPVCPKLFKYVDGTGDPENLIYLFIYDLSPFDGRIWDMGRRYAVLTGYSPSYPSDILKVMSYHPDAPGPGEFSLTSPAEGSEGTDPGHAVFRWENSAGASEYVLTVARDPEMKDIVLTRDGLIETSALVRGALEENTEYFWQVTAKTAGGRTRSSGVSRFACSGK